MPTLVAPDADRRKEPRPAGAAGSMTSRAAFSRPTGAPSSTCDAKAVSNPSSARSRPTAALTGSALRPISREIGMAAADRDAQPPKASPPPARERLNASANRGARAATNRRASSPPLRLDPRLTRPKGHPMQHWSLNGWRTGPSAAAACSCGETPDEVLCAVEGRAFECRAMGYDEMRAATLEALARMPGSESEMETVRARLRATARTTRGA